jgi:hypothetical protein
VWTSSGPFYQPTSNAALPPIYPNPPPATPRFLGGGNNLSLPKRPSCTSGAEDDASFQPATGHRILTLNINGPLSQAVLAVFLKLIFFLLLDPRSRSSRLFSVLAIAQVFFLVACVA